MGLAQGGRLVLSAVIAAAALALRLDGRVEPAAAAVVAAVVVALLPVRGRWAWLLPLVALGVGGLAWRWMSPGVAAWVLGAVPLLGDLVFGLHFGRSLRPGQEPVIAGYIRAEEGAAPAEAGRYARRLTALWAAGFAVLGVGQVASLAGLLATPAVMGAVHLGVIAALFIGEHAVRPLVFPGRTASPLRTLRSVLKARHAG